MSRTLAIIQDGLVSNVIAANTWPGSIDVTDVHPRPSVGWGYALVDGQHVFSPSDPEPDPEPIVENHWITNFAFDMRYTADERVNIDLAGIHDATAPIETQRLQARVRVQLERAAKAEYTDLKDPRTRAGVIEFETAQLIDPGRALQILDAPILESERFSK